jgi:zinc transport system substrate-binding protein
MPPVGDRRRPGPKGTTLKSLPITVWVFACWVLGSAAVNPAYAGSPPNLKAVTTLFPLQEFTRAVGGENVQADLLLPPGAEPHAWEPKPGDVVKVFKADLFVYIGPAMEPWAKDLLKAVQGSHLTVVEASKGLPLLPAKESHKGPASDKPLHADPHIWLDFSLDRIILGKIATAFSQKDPSRSSAYFANAERYKAKLADLDQKYKAGLASCQQRRFFVGGHSAFAYLARRYGLEQTTLYGVSPNAEPTPKRLTEVIQAARNQGVRVIFFEELVNPKLARLLAKEAQIGTKPLYNGANLTRDQLRSGVTFLQLMESNLENLRQGLLCEYP